MNYKARNKVTGVIVVSANNQPRIYTEDEKIAIEKSTHLKDTYIFIPAGDAEAVGVDEKENKAAQEAAEAAKRQIEAAQKAAKAAAAKAEKLEKENEELKAEAAKSADKKEDKKSS